MNPRPFPRKTVLASLFTTGAALLAGAEARADVITVTEPGSGVDITYNGPYDLAHNRGFQAYNGAQTLFQPLFRIGWSNFGGKGAIGITQGSGHANAQNFVLGTASQNGTKYVKHFNLTQVSAFKSLSALGLAGHTSVRAHITAVTAGATNTATGSP